MKKFISAKSSLLMSVLEIIIGILLLINPIGFTSGIIVAFSIVIMFMGVGNIIKYFRTEAWEAAGQGDLSRGILFVILGCFCSFRSGWIIATLSVVTVLYGIITMIVGVNKLQKAVDMARIKQKYWFFVLLNALLTIAFAVLIVANPFVSTAVLWNFIGITLIIEAVIDVVTFILSRKARKD